MNSILEYLDYRDYLNDRFSHDKRSKPFMSFRYVKSKTGIDASFYSKILKKKKHVSLNKIPVIASLLELEGGDQLYFETLVRFNRAKDDNAAQDLLRKLLSLRSSIAKKVDDLEYFQTWYTVPIRELLGHIDFDGDYQSLANLLTPAITSREAKNAINILLSLGLVQKDGQGFLRPVDQVISTGDCWKGVAIRMFQKKMIQLGMESIDSIDKELRDISTITLSTSLNSLPQIKERLAEARRDIIKLIEAEDDTDGVFQLNLQFFPLTKIN